MLDELANNITTFDHLRHLQDELFLKVRERFLLRMDSSTTRFQPYASIDGLTTGSLAGFSGPEIDWLVYSWIGSAETSFSNIRLTVWLGPQTRVPHITFTFGTFPVLFFLMDYLPRVDIAVNPDYIDRYLEPANRRVLELNADKQLTPYVNQNMYMRVALSQAGLNYLCSSSTDGMIDLIRIMSHEYLDRWLNWVDEAEPVPESKQTVLAERDLRLRRINAERDPTNVVAARIYGPELTNALVRATWGADRLSLRPLPK